MDLDTSSLAPYQPSAPSVGSGLDLSSLQPMDSSALTPVTPAPTLGDVGKQFGFGLLSGIPNAVESAADAVVKPFVTDPFTGNNWESEAAQHLGLGNLDGILPPAGQVGPGYAIKSVLNAVGLNPDNLPQPQSGPERIANMAGQGAVLAVTPELALGRAAEASSIIGNLLRAATTGTVAGASGQAATEVAPDQYKPLAGLAGGLVVGLGSELAASGLAKAGEGIGNIAAPFTQAGREAAVGAKLANAASDPTAAIAAVDTQPAEIVPGSQPTTFQQTGDMGLGSLERSVATQNPDLFKQRLADQNQARLAALSNVQAEGHPEAVSDFVRGQLGDIDQSTQDAFDTATQQAKAAADNIGGAQPPEALGNQLRDTLQAQLDSQRTNERALWSAVDPDGALNVVTSPLKRAASSIYGDATPEQALTMTPMEQQFAGLINSYGPTLPFARLTDLRSGISAAMRDAKSPLQPNDVAYGRLSQLRGAVEDAISDSVQGKAAEEQTAVASGALAPEDTMFANMANEREGWVAGKAQQAATGTGGGTSLGPDGPDQPAAVPSAHGTEVPNGGGLAGDASPEGLPQDAGSGPPR